MLFLVVFKLTAKMNQVFNFKKKQQHNVKKILEKSGNFVRPDRTSGNHVFPYLEKKMNIQILCAV